MAQRLAIVSTLKAAQNVLASFIDHHLGLGFERLFLVFDDPDDAAIPLARDRTGVEVIVADREWRERWRQAPSWHNEFVREHIEDEIISRQVLNLELVMAMARERGYDWLLHIDLDELFWCARRSPAEHFALLSERRVGAINYANHEVIPERPDIDDFFREATLFKQNRRSLPGGALSDAQEALLKGIPQVPDRYFHYYANGKSAVRLEPGCQQDGPHEFRPARGWCRAQSNIDPVVLHFPSCGFDNWWRRYQARGAFPDHWFGATPVADSIGRTHLESRDLVARDNPEAAREWYRQRFVIDDAMLIDRLLRAGVCRRFRPFASSRSPRNATK